MLRLFQIKWEFLVKKQYSVLENFKFFEINDGENLKIGKFNIEYIKIPMVHWSDSIEILSKYEKIIFPNDAFGEHKNTLKLLIMKLKKIFYLLK